MNTSPKTTTSTTSAITPLKLRFICFPFLWTDSRYKPTRHKQPWRVVTLPVSTCAAAAGTAAAKAAEPAILSATVAATATPATTAAPATAAPSSAHHAANPQTRPEAPSATISTTAAPSTAPEQEPKHKQYKEDPKHAGAGRTRVPHRLATI